MKRQYSDFVDNEQYPLDASTSGSNARHINGCPIIGQSQPYAVCLKRIADFEAGQNPDFVGDCRRAMGGPACAAHAMRQEEIKAGYAIFYINRAKLQAHMGIIASDALQARVSANQGQALSSPASSLKRLPEGSKGVPKGQIELAAQGGTYADAINAEIGKMETQQ